MKKSACRKQSFTLVEIIAVLIILGILIAVAVPKYFSLVAEARDRAAAGAVAEGMSICSLAYSRAVLIAGGSPALNGTANAVLELAQAESGNIKGDFSVAFAVNGTTGIDVTATGRTARVGGANATATAVWTMPDQE